MANGSRKILRKFKKYAKTGRGKAFMIFRENRNLDFSSIIWDLCRRNYGYDPQCEGDRSEYALQFFRALGDAEKARIAAKTKDVLLAYKIADECDWDCLHFFITAAKIAREGFPEIGGALLRRFDECDDYSACRVFPVESILTLLGFDGLAKVAERRGEAFLRDKDESESDYLFYCVRGLDGEDAKAKLEELAESNGKIRAFLERIAETEKLCAENEKARESGKSAFERVKSLAKNNKMIPRYLRKALGDDERKYFAKALLEQKTQSKRAGYLRIFDPFGKVVYPGDVRDLLPLFSTRKNSWYNERLVDVLSAFSHDELRAIAENALNSDDYAFFYLYLLKKNYRSGDGEKIARKLKKQKRPHDFHRAGLTVLDIYESNCTKDCLLPLSILAEESVCSQCRASAVGLLEKAGVLSDEMREERPFDSYELGCEYESKC